tara:strand:- start:5465 stop:6394 length:930 start_codon:yes stop_codon:yes gene_type:complete
MKNILVLGGNGFMGKNIQKAFESSPCNMFYESRRTGFDLHDLNLTIKKIKNIAPSVIIFAAANVGNIEYVSQNAASVVNDNSQMYLNLYKAVSVVNPNIIIINPISNCSYPGIIDIQHEELWWDGEVHPSIESYGFPKKLGYIISKCYKKEYGIKTLNFIVPNAYGPNDYIDASRTHALNGIIMRMIQSQQSKEKEFLIWGTGTPVREWIYMPDVARLIKEVVDNGLYDLPDPINIGQENGVSILESSTMARKALAYDVEFKFDTTKQDGAPIKVLGNKKFKQLFPNFTFTEVSEGIQDTIDYYKKHLI